MSSTLLSNQTQLQHADLFAGSLRLGYTDEGKGERTFLLLHGGAGPTSFKGLTAALIDKGTRVVMPIHPGFAGETRPDRIMRIDDLVLAYLALIDHLKLSNVTVVGNSMGGWIASELGLRQSPFIKSIVIINGVGIDTSGTSLTIIDPTTIPPAERAAAAFYNTKYAIVPSSPDAVNAMVNNHKALNVYAGDPFCYEPTLRSRLSGMKVRAMVLWGENDRIVTADYGRLYAKSIPNARFELVKEAGHFPQIEQLVQVVELIDNFVGDATRQGNEN